MSEPIQPPFSNLEPINLLTLLQTAGWEMEALRAELERARVEARAFRVIAKLSDSMGPGYCSEPSVKNQLSHAISELQAKLGVPSPDRAKYAEGEK